MTARRWRVLARDERGRVLEACWAHACSTSPACAKPDHRGRRACPRQRAADGVSRFAPVNSYACPHVPRDARTPWERGDRGFAVV
jgi:hypothetical protein